MRLVVGAVAAFVAGCGFEPGRLLFDASNDGDAIIGDSSKIDALVCEQPVAHWRFDEGSGTMAADSSGRANHLSLMGTATWTAGQTGTALSLPGGSWATLAYNPTFATTRQVSVTAWIKTDSISRTGGIVVKSARYGPYQDWGFYAEDAEAMFICNWPSPDLRGVTSGFALVVNKWIHVAFVLDADAGTTAFYKNGALHSTIAFTADLLQHDEPITVGTDGGSTANDFIGAIDDITIWTRALTATEVAALHAGLCVPETSGT